MNRRSFLRNALLAGSGVLAGKTLVEVAVAILTPEPEIMGYTGKQYLSSGFVYAPYIPMVDRGFDLSGYNDGTLRLYAGTRINPKNYGRLVLITTKEKT